MCPPSSVPVRSLWRWWESGSGRGPGGGTPECREEIRSLNSTSSSSLPGRGLLRRKDVYRIFDEGLSETSSPSCTCCVDLVIKSDLSYHSFSLKRVWWVGNPSSPRDPSRNLESRDRLEPLP